MALLQPKRLNLATLPLILDDALVWVTDRRDHVRNYALVGALAFFATGLIWSIRTTPELHSDFRLAPLLVLLIISAPVSTTLSAIEMHAISRIAGGPMTWRTSFELTVFSSAANMLPLPGGGLAKLAAMKAHGVGYKVGSAMIVLSFLVWGALAFIYAGGALFLLGNTVAAAAFWITGGVLLAGGLIGYVKFGQWKYVAIVAATRIISFPLESLRYLLAILSIGASINFLQASVYIVASFVGSAVVIVPNGLGVSETAAAILSTIIGISAATGFMGTAIGRIVRLIGLAAMAGVLVWASKRRSKAAAAEPYSGSA